jgi:hypothetical protein
MKLLWVGSVHLSLCMPEKGVDRLQWAYVSLVSANFCTSCIFASRKTEGATKMSSISREGKATTSATQDSLHSKPSSLMTDEDWDQLFAKEQQEKSGVDTSSATELQRANVSPLRVIRGVEKEPVSPRRVGKESGQYSTPSSPSEILRLTRRTDGQDGIKVEEAAQFEKELGNWVRILKSEHEGVAILKTRIYLARSMTNSLRLKMSAH